MTCTGVGGEDYPIIGFATAAETFANTYLGQRASGCGYVCADGSLRQNGGTMASAPSYYLGSRFGIGYDYATGTLLIKTSGSSYSATLASPFTAPLYICFNGFNNGDGFRIETDVSLGLPSGYSHWQ